jgi:hypothetical protein
MSKHLKRVPPSFDAPDPRDVVPDTADELMAQGQPTGDGLLDSLRRAPRAIEPPRSDDDRPDSPRGS